MGSEACGLCRLDTRTLAQMARDETLRQDGVARMKIGWPERLRLRKTPGVTARIDPDGWLHIDISIVAGRSSGIYQIGATVQDAVFRAIRSVSAQPIGGINVRINQIKKDPDKQPAKA